MRPREAGDIVNDLRQVADWDVIASIDLDPCPIRQIGNFHRYVDPGYTMTITCHVGAEQEAEKILAMAGLARDYEHADGQRVISTDTKRPISRGLRVLFATGGVRS